MRQRWEEWRAKKARENRKVLTKGAAEKGRKKRKLKAMPGTAFKKFKEASNTLLDQLKDLATSGGLAGVLTTAGVATAASVAAVSSGLVDAVADRLPWTEPDAEVEQVETVAVTAVDQAMAALDEAEQASEAVATVEAMFDGVPTNDDLEELRQELLGEFDEFRTDVGSLSATVSALEQQVADEAATVNTRLTAAESGTASALEQIAAIEIPDVSGIDANTVAVGEIQNELAIARAAINEIPALRGAIESAEGLAVLARAEAGIAGDELDAVRAEVAAQEAALGAADVETVAALAQAEEAFLLAQQNETRADQALEQAAVLETNIEALGTDVATAQATADAAATQTELDAAVQQMRATRAVADQAAANAVAAQAYAVALAADLTATDAEVTEAQQAAAAAQAQADNAAITATQAQAAADTAQAAADRAQTDATEALDTIQVPIRVTLASGTPSGFVPLNNGLTWPQVIATYDTVTVTIIGSNGVVGQQFPVSAFASEVPIFFGANDSRRGEITPAFPNLVATGATGLTNQQYTITASGLQPAVAVDPFPVTAGPGQPMPIPTGPWQIGDTPALITEDGTYLVTLVAKYQSGSGNRVYQGVAVDGVRLDLAVEHQDYALFIPLTYTAAFRLELTAGQTVNQALSHNSNGDTPWTSVLVLAERIG